MPPRQKERRAPDSRLPDIRSFIAPLKRLSLRRRATPLLYLELTGLQDARSGAARRARAAACKRVVGAALRGSIGSVLRGSDLSAAGPGGQWFAVLLVGRSVAAKQRASLDDADLGIVAARLRASVQAALSAAERSGKIPFRVATRIGWSVVEPVAAARAAQEVRQSIRGAAVVARVEERRALVLGSITHELRTPLTSIVGYAEMLGQNGARGRQGARKREATRHRYAAIIADEARRLNRLVDGLIDVGAWSVGKLTLRTTELAVGEVAAAARIALTPVAKARNVRCLIRGEATITADRERFFQVLINVLDNAIRHARRGGTVAIEITPHDHSCRIAVTDDGTGFDAAILKALGEPFNTSATGRTGLGLAIAQLLAEAHGGSISADNPDDGGGRVAILMPAAGFRYSMRGKRTVAGANTRL